MIRLERIRYRYPASGWVLDGIELRIRPGEYAAVLGTSGSGKSTLSYLFNGLVPHFFGGRLEGRVRVDGIDTRASTVGRLLTQAGLVMQNADAQLFHSRVENDIAFGLESLGLPAAQIERKIAAVAAELQIDALLQRSPQSLSGGEKRLAAVAAVLAIGSPLLILDEPFANLDWKGIRRVRRTLQGIHARGRTVVVIEQRTQQFLEDFQRCLVLDKGRLVHDAAAPTGCNAAALRRFGLVPVYAGCRPDLPRKTGAPVLSVRGLRCSFDGREILRGLSFDLDAGESVALVGPNGSGKTTLIRHFNGLLRAQDGSVTYRGRRPEDRGPAEMAAGVGLCFQNPNDQFFRTAVKEELDEGLKRRAPRDPQWFDKVVELLKLRELLDRSPHRLSEGEKKRVSMAAILVMQPEILVLDEPTVGQDARFKEILAQLLCDLNRSGITTVVVTHDLDFAEAAAARWIVLHRGQVAADGPPDQLRGREGLVAAGALPPPAAVDSGVPR